MKTFFTPNPDVSRVFGATLKDGRHVQFFVNTKTNLIVVDVIDADEKGGVEILRRVVE